MWRRGHLLVAGLAVLSPARQLLAQSAPSGTELTLGGLVPPGAGQTAPYASPASPEQQLQRAEREDSGRGLQWFWASVESGFEHLGLGTIAEKNLVDNSDTRSTQSGLLVGGALGARVFVFTLGPRLRWGRFSDWQLWTLNGEVGFRIPVGRLEPYLSVSGGYASVGSLDPGHSLAREDVSIKGWNLTTGGGLDVYPESWFSVGGSLTGEMLFLSRPAVPLSRLGNHPGSAYAVKGSSIGAGVLVTAVAGIHF